MGLAEVRLCRCSFSAGCDSPHGACVVCAWSSAAAEGAPSRSAAVAHRGQPACSGSPQSACQPPASGVQDWTANVPSPRYDPLSLFHPIVVCTLQVPLFHLHSWSARWSAPENSLNSSQGRSFESGFDLSGEERCSRTFLSTSSPSIFSA